MEDRELLEVAAKAAGMKAQYSDNFGDFSIGEPYSKGEIRWNPLTDDGDALRLAAELRMTVDIGLWREEAQVRAYDKILGGMYHIDEKGDRLVASRRAIVRAAAEIGKAMP